MIASEKSYQNISDYTQFLFKKDFKLIKTDKKPSEKMRNSGHFIHDYANSFFREYSKSNALIYWYL